MVLLVQYTCGMLDHSLVGVEFTLGEFNLTIISSWRGGWARNICRELAAGNYVQ